MKRTTRISVSHGVSVSAISFMGLLTKDDAQIVEKLASVMPSDYKYANESDFLASMSKAWKIWKRHMEFETAKKFGFNLANATVELVPVHGESQSVRFVGQSVNETCHVYGRMVSDSELVNDADTSINLQFIHVLLAERPEVFWPDEPDESDASRQTHRDCVGFSHAVVCGDPHGQVSAAIVAGASTP